MTCTSHRIPLLVIGGPTATGKTEVAVAIAARVGGEIVSADSMQIYRDLDVGTAKPPGKQRERVPIHLVDFVAPDEEYSVAAYQRDARETIVDIHSRGRLPILTGGTGLYLRAVLEHFDLPDVYRALYGKKLQIIQPLSAEMKWMTKRTALARLKDAGLKASVLG